MLHKQRQLWQNQFWQVLQNDCCAAINGRVLLYFFFLSSSISGNLESTRVSSFFFYSHCIHFTVFLIFAFWKTELLDYSSKPTMIMHNIFISHYIPVNYVHAGKNAQRQVLRVVTWQPPVSMSVHVNWVFESITFRGSSWLSFGNSLDFKLFRIILRSAVTHSYRPAYHWDEKWLSLCKSTRRPKEWER